MFKRIMVAVGGNEDASETVPIVTALAKAFDSDVLVVHLRLRVVKALTTEEAESIHESFKFGEDVVARLQDAGVKATSDVDSARPENLGQFLLEKAANFTADLIVIGGHHAHGLRDKVFGDMGKTLAHGAQCPLLMMPSEPE
jgi:nucleotide-binding universal stress UspA family protein